MPDLEEVSREHEERQRQEFYNDLPLREEEEEEEIDDLVARAQQFAHEKHNGQSRKDNITPFISHPANLVKTLIGIGATDSTLLSAAWLHDTVEDTDTTLDEIRAEFGDDIHDLVDIVTRQGDRWDFHDRVAASGSEAQLLKIADLEHNFRTIQYLSDEGKQRKYREAITYYLPLEESLTQAFPDYRITSVFSDLKDHVDEFMRRYGSLANTCEGLPKRKLLKQQWTEKEIGSAQPYGYSLHKDRDERDGYVERNRTDIGAKELEYFISGDSIGWTCTIQYAPSGNPFSVEVNEYMYWLVHKHGTERFFD